MRSPSTLSMEQTRFGKPWVTGQVSAAYGGFNRINFNQMIPSK
jgi:hypothetical protein